MKRRRFVQNTALFAAANLATQGFSIGSNMFSVSKVRLGFIGVGARGLGTMELAMMRQDIEVVAICDIDHVTLGRALDMITKAGRKKPAVYSDGEYDFKRLLLDKNVDAVMICTPWEWHTPMSVAAMKSGKAVACEVAGAMSLDECWQLVRTQEETGTPFMIMENVCYRRDIMAVLNMVRQGLFGELIHLEGGYQHDLREVKFNDGVNYCGLPTQCTEMATCILRMASALWLP